MFSELEAFETRTRGESARLANLTSGEVCAGMLTSNLPPPGDGTEAAVNRASSDVNRFTGRRKTLNKRAGQSAKPET